MKFKYSALYAAILSASLGMVGCSSSSTPSADATGTDTSVTGRITGFGSVFVDGVEYDTGTTTVIRDGVEVTVPADDALRIGMIVTLSGTANGNQGTATSIEFNDDLEGLVQANGLAAGGSLLVMGQNVTVDANTNFESEDATITTVEDIPENAVVEISGYPDGNGNILATFIELKVADVTAPNSGYDDDMEVKGLVAELDTTAETFMLGNLLVDYSGITLDADVTLADGLFVEVKFAVTTDQSGASTLEVVKVELENDGEYGVRGEPGEDFELEGVITNIDTANGTFEVNGQTIQIPQNFDISSFTANDLVSLDVSVDANGDIVVDEIERDHADDDGNGFEMVAEVTAVDSTAGTITVDDRTVNVDRFNTIMKDDREVDANGVAVTPVQYFSIDDIVAGDWLEMKISEDAEGNLTAVKIERIDADDAREEMEAVITLVNGELFAGDLNLTTALSSVNADALTRVTDLLAAAGDEDLEVEVVVNPESGALESLVLEVEGTIAVDNATNPTTATINGIDLSTFTGVDLAAVMERAGQEAEAKIDLVSGSVNAMRSEIEGAVESVNVEAGTAVVNGVEVALPIGMSLEAGQNVELDLDAAGNVISLDIELEHEMEERLQNANGGETGATNPESPESTTGGTEQPIG